MHLHCNCCKGRCSAQPSSARLHCPINTCLLCPPRTGAPFEASKRRLVGPLVYLHAALWLCWLGFMPFALWVVHHIQVRRACFAEPCLSQTLCGGGQRHRALTRSTGSPPPGCRAE